MHAGSSKTSIDRTTSSVADSAAAAAARAAGGITTMLHDVADPATVGSGALIVPHVAQAGTRRGSIAAVAAAGILMLR